MKQEEQGPMELRHEPVPGYRKIFYIVFTVAVLYLAAIFLFGAGMGH